MSSPPTVSVVVPAFNARRFVAATVNSVLDQSYTDFELLISDHSSTDGTWEILQGLSTDPRVRLVQISPGGGAAANWTAVSARAKGTYLKLVCDDDLLDHRCLERQVATMERYPGVVLVASRRSVIDAEGNALMRARGLGGLQGQVTGRDAVRRAVRSGSNIFGEPAGVLMVREALVRAGGWDSSNPYVIDQATFSNVLLQGDLFAQQSVLASFRLHSGQWSAALAREQSQQVIAFHGKLALENPGLLSPTDLLVGNFRAVLSATGRRMVYAMLSKRSRLSPKKDASGDRGWCT